MAKSALKFKDSVAQYERIAAEVAARRFSGIYLLMGEESYFIDALSDQLAATILDEAARAFNQITVYGRDSEAGQVINLCRQMPMMGQYQVAAQRTARCWNRCARATTRSRRGYSSSSGRKDSRSTPRRFRC